MEGEQRERDGKRFREERREWGRGREKEQREG
jgi:hypothetical protein